jgi:hypothetical protein
MNEVEARLALVKNLQSYRSHSHAHLATAACIGRGERLRIGRYQIAIKVVWENVSEGTVKVTASIIDGGARPEGPPLLKNSSSSLPRIPYLFRSSASSASPEQGSAVLSFFCPHSAIFPTYVAARGSRRAGNKT